MPKKRSRTLLPLVIFLFLLPLGIAAIFFSWWWQVTQPVDAKNTERQIFVIPKGSGVSAIANGLKEAGLIRDALAFKIMVTKEGIAKDLQAGDFYLIPSMNLFEIAQTLTHGTVDVWVTIPEGLRREEVAAIFKKTFQSHGVDFDTEGFLKETKSLEGYLFPDTYLIPKTASVAQVVEILRRTFDQKIPDEEKLKANKVSLSFSQVMVLASLVEREAKFEKDRALVAGILLKRLKNDWPLQADASLQYALGTKDCRGKATECNWWPKVTDTKLDSPYNTYTRRGLPPTPICNPSRSSLEAVLNPKTSQYWYYLSDKSGQIHYAETLEEHEKNIEDYLE